MAVHHDRPETLEGGVICYAGAAPDYHLARQRASSLPPPRVCRLRPLPTVVSQRTPKGGLFITADVALCYYFIFEAI